MLRFVEVLAGEKKPWDIWDIELGKNCPTACSLESGTTRSHATPGSKRTSVQDPIFTMRFDFVSVQQASVRTLGLFEAARDCERSADLIVIRVPLCKRACCQY